MTYDESATLMNDMKFQGRVKTATLNYAAYMMAEPTDTPAHTTRVRWAQNAYLNPDQAARQITPPVVMTAQVQQDGAMVSDANLQLAVESVVNQVM